MRNFKNILLTCVILLMGIAKNYAAFELPATDYPVVMECIEPSEVSPVVKAIVKDQPALIRVLHNTMAIEHHNAIAFSTRQKKSFIAILLDASLPLPKLFRHSGNMRTTARIKYECPTSICCVWNIEAGLKTSGAFNQPVLPKSNAWGMNIALTLSNPYVSSGKSESALTKTLDSNMPLSWLSAVELIITLGK